MCESHLTKESKASKSTGIDTGSFLKKSRTKETIVNTPEIVNKEDIHKNP